MKIALGGFEWREGERERDRDRDVCVLGQFLRCDEDNKSEKLNVRASSSMVPTTTTTTTCHLSSLYLSYLAL